MSASYRTECSAMNKEDAVDKVTAKCYKEWHEVDWDGEWEYATLCNECLGKVIAIRKAVKDE